MVNIRELAERDLAVTLEDPTNGFGLPVILTPPDGEALDVVYGKILYDTKVFDPELGTDIVVHRPVVTVRRSTLVAAGRVPVSGERWKVEIPVEPRVDAPKETFVFECPVLDGQSIGYIKMELHRPRQAPA